MASLHRFVIVVSAVIFVGVIQAITTEFPGRLLDNNESLYSPLLLASEASTATSETPNGYAIHQTIGLQNSGLNVIGTQHSNHIQQQVNIKHTNITVNNPYQDAQTGQLYFQPAFETINLTEELTQTLGSTNPKFILSDKLHTNVKITVTGMLPRTTVTQTFINQSDEWVSGYTDCIFK